MVKPPKIFIQATPMQIFVCYHSSFQVGRLMNEIPVTDINFFIFYNLSMECANLATIFVSASLTLFLPVSFPS